MSANLPPETPENPTPPAPPEPQQTPPPERGRLIRSRSDRMLGGVAGGLGHYFGIDAVIVRIALVVLTFFGGAGALLYLAALLLVPNEDEVPGGAGPAGTAGARLGERNRGLTILGIVLLVVVAGPLLFAPALFAGGIVVPLAFLVLLGLGVSWLVTGRRPERDAASIARATLVGLGVVAALCALFVGAFWTAGLGGEAVVAGIVIAAGAGVLIAAFVKPARWLILPALAVAIPATFVAAAGIDLDGGIGERTYRPASATQIREHYEIGAGRLEIDLRQADLPAGQRTLDVDVGMGEAVIIVPDDVCVSTEARVGMGATSVFQRTNGGIDVSWEEQNTARAGTPQLLVDADIGLGHLDVRKTSPRDDFGRFRERRSGDRGGVDWDDWQDTDRGSNTACAA